MAKTVKEIVVAFRLTAPEASALQKAHEKQPIVGVKSRNMLARKLALDWSQGRLHYRTKKDLLVGHIAD